MALSPWPASTATMTLKAVTAELRAALGLRANETDAPDDMDRDLQRTAAAASARIERYAPGAPGSVKDEALVRATAYLRDTQGAARFFRPDQQFRTLNPPAANARAAEFAATDYTPPPAFSDRAFRASGAMALLAPWRVRNAGLVQAQA